MYLNNGEIIRELLNKYGSFKNILNHILRSRRLKADLIIEHKLVKQCIITFSTDSGYVMANISDIIAFTNNISYSSIEINVYDEAGDCIIKSYTDGLNSMIPKHDVEVELWFKVGSIYPHNELKPVVPESCFASLHSRYLSPVNFESLQSVVTNGDDNDSNEEEEESP